MTHACPPPRCCPFSKRLAGGEGPARIADAEERRIGGQSVYSFDRESRAAFAHLVESVHIQLADEGAKVRVLEEPGQQLASEAVGGGDWKEHASQLVSDARRSRRYSPKNESPSSLHRIRSSVSGSDTMLLSSRGSITSETLVDTNAPGIAQSGRIAVSQLYRTSPRSHKPAKTIHAPFATHLRASTRQPRTTSPTVIVRACSPVQLVEECRNSPLRRLVGHCRECRGRHRELVRGRGERSGEGQLETGTRWRRHWRCRRAFARHLAQSQQPGASELVKSC